MKQQLIIMVLLLSILHVYAERNSINIVNNQWYIGNSIPLSPDNFRNIEASLQAFDQTSISTTDTNSVVCLSTVIDLAGDQSSKASVSIEKGNGLFNVFVNGTRLENYLQGENFLSETDSNPETGEIVLSLSVKKGLQLEGDSLSNILKDIKITAYNGIDITWVTTSKEPFFGCYALEIHVLNTFDKDIDGKLYAHILNPETLEEVGVNNNCAFSRSGTESEIEIVFPDLQTSKIKGNYLAEIVLVDKEKNEQEIDKLSVPINLN